VEVTVGRYQIRFFVESPLAADEDLLFTHRGHTLDLLFHTGDNTSQGFEIQVICEAANYVEAIRFASDELIPPVLDSIAFHRKTTLSLGGFRRVAKDERGSARRRLILVDRQRYEVHPRIDQAWVREIQAIIDSDPAPWALALRWLRMAYRQIWTLDRFIYTWLALENLAGEREVRKVCPHCHGELPSYPAADRANAERIITDFDTTLRVDFHRWWQDLRNPVFHGDKEPGAKLLSQLDSATQKIMPAVEMFIEHHLGPMRRATPAQPTTQERGQNIWYMLEFDAPQIDQAFSYPTPDLTRLRTLMDQGRCTEEEMGCRALSQGEFENW
jgi:hypothetical protein